MDLTGTVTFAIMIDAGPHGSGKTIKALKSKRDTRNGGDSIFKTVVYDNDSLFYSSTFRASDEYGGVLDVHFTPKFTVKIANAFTFTDTLLSGWRQLVATHGAFIDTDSMRQQYACHVMGHAALVLIGDLEYNLEYNRKSNPDFIKRIPSSIFPTFHPGDTCNW
jgi:hypothetical protein